jgi:GT2 family glycosyltransferase
MQVSIIIVNYNTKDITENCIVSIISQTKDVEYEIILVDNASADGSKEYFEKRNGICYIYSNENLGFGRANNLGQKKLRENFCFC